MELLHLAHFIEAGFGLCIAFTIIDDVNLWGQKMCESFRKKKSEKWEQVKQSEMVIKEPGGNAGGNTGGNILESNENR